MQQDVPLDGAGRRVIHAMWPKEVREALQYGTTGAAFAGLGLGGTLASGVAASRASGDLASSWTAAGYGLLFGLVGFVSLFIGFVCGLVGFTKGLGLERSMKNWPSLVSLAPRARRAWILGLVGLALSGLTMIFFMAGSLLKSP